MKKGKRDTTQEPSSYDFLESRLFRAQIEVTAL